MHDELAHHDVHMQEAMASREKALHAELDDNRHRENGKSDSRPGPDPFVYSSMPINREASSRGRRPSPSFRSSDSFHGAQSSGSAQNTSVVVVHPTPCQFTFIGEKKDDINWAVA